MAFLLSSLSLKLAAFSLTLSLPLCSRDTTREMDCSVHWFEIEMRQVRGRKARARKESTVFFLVERVLKKNHFFPFARRARKKKNREREQERERESSLSPLSRSLFCVPIDPLPGHEARTFHASSIYSREKRNVSRQGPRGGGVESAIFIDACQRRRR